MAEWRLEFEQAEKRLLELDLNSSFVDDGDDDDDEIDGGKEMMGWKWGESVS